MVLRVRPLANREGKKLQQTLRSAKQVVVYKRAQIVLLSAQGFRPPYIADLTGLYPDTVRTVIQAFNERGFEALKPNYAGGRPPKFTQKHRSALVSLALSRPRDLNLPFQEWSLTRLRREAIKRGIVSDISREWLRVILQEAAVSYQATKTWKESNDPDFEKKKRRIERILAMKHNPPVVLAMDEMGPISVRPHPGRGWARHKRPPRIPATYHKPHGIRYLFGVYNVKKKKLSGRLYEQRNWENWLAVLKLQRRKYPKQHRIYVIQDNLSTHTTPDIMEFVRANKISFVPTPTEASWLNPIETRFKDLNQLAIAGSNHPSWEEMSVALQRGIRYLNRYPPPPRKVRKCLWTRQ